MPSRKPPLPRIAEKGQRTLDACHVGRCDPVSGLCASSSSRAAASSCRSALRSAAAAPPTVAAVTWRRASKKPASTSCARSFATVGGSYCRHNQPRPFLPAFAYFASFLRSTLRHCVYGLRFRYDGVERIRDGHVHHHFVLPLAERNHSKQKNFFFEGRCIIRCRGVAKAIAEKVDACEGGGSGKRVVLFTTNWAYCVQWRWCAA